MEKKLGYAISWDSDLFLTPPFSFPVYSGITEQQKLNDFSVVHKNQSVNRNVMTS